MTYQVKMPEAYARVNWCKETFGPCNKMRWYRKRGYLIFRLEDDYIMYKLRWI